MSFNVSPRAPYGSLLKSERPVKHKPHRPARDKDDKHLAAVRQCMCLSCGSDPAGVAAHVRMSAPGKVITGIGIKPDDKYTLPLCPACHTDGPEAQHKIGEINFYKKIGIDALVICARLYAVSPDVAKMREVIREAR